MKDPEASSHPILDPTHVRIHGELLGLVGHVREVWRAMVDARDDHGLCRATFAELAEATSLTLGQVRHALTRHLVPSGLVVVQGRDIAVGQQSQRYNRLVVGHGDSDGLVRMPHSVCDRVMATPESKARLPARPSVRAVSGRCHAPPAGGLLCGESALGHIALDEMRLYRPSVADKDACRDAAGRRQPVKGGASKATEHTGRCCEAATQTHPLTMAAYGCHLGHACVAKGEEKMPSPKGGQPRGPIAPGADPKVRCVAALQVDGATSFVAKSSEAQWHVDVQDALRGARSGSVVRLPDPIAPGPIALEVKHNYQGKVRLQVDERVTIRIDRSRNTVEVVAAKEELWNHDGVEAWAKTWLRLTSHWFLGQQCAGLLDAGSAGWRVHRLELASDFTGFPVRSLDEPNFRSRQKISAWGSSLAKNGERETVEVGARGRGPISISIHDKHAQIEKVHKVKPVASIYAPLWKTNGWQGRARVRRVEVRADGKALKLRHAKTGAIADLSDPSALLDRDKLARLWHEATHLHVLKLPSEGVGKGRKPGTDPRWMAVQSVAGLATIGRFIYATRITAPTNQRRTELAKDSFVHGAACLFAAGELPSDEREQLKRIAGILGREQAFANKVDTSRASLRLVVRGKVHEDPDPEVWTGE